jgi:hypothetical protein
MMNKKILAIATTLAFILLLGVSLIRKSDPLISDSGLSKFRVKSPSPSLIIAPIEEQEAETFLNEEQSPSIVERTPDNPEFDTTAFDFLDGQIMIRKDECVVMLETVLPNEGIIDPGHSLYESMQDELLAVTLDVISSFVSIPSQELYSLIYDVAMGGDEFDVHFLKERLDRAEVCYHPRGLTYLQVLMEAADMYRWSTPVRRRHGEILLRILSDEILSFPSSTNLVFALSTLRSLGQANFAYVEDLEEIDSLLSRVIEQFERLSMTAGSAPRDRELRQAFRDLLDENELLRQQVRDLFVQALSGS